MRLIGEVKESCCDTKFIDLCSPSGATVRLGGWRFRGGPTQPTCKVHKPPLIPGHRDHRVLQTQASQLDASIAHVHPQAGQVEQLNRCQIRFRNADTKQAQLDKAQLLQIHRQTGS